MACGVRQELKHITRTSTARENDYGLNGLWGPSGIETISFEACILPCVLGLNGLWGPSGIETTIVVKLVRAVRNCLNGLWGPSGIETIQEAILVAHLKQV